MNRSILAIALLVSACSREAAFRDDPSLYQSNTTALTPGVQAVRIGEGGPAYPACASAGVVVNLSPEGEAYLPVRAAPFAEAQEIARLGEGAKLFLCQRSLDQRWQGVVVPPAGSAQIDCGVTAPLATARAYAGPCKAGWVLSGFVRPVAD